MVNWITKNCKTKHYILLLTCFFIANTAIASTQAINIYLKLKPDNQVSKLIKEFDQFLEQQHVFIAYQITPYLEQYPLHVTLYLARYEQTQIPQIINKAATLAKQQKQIPLLTAKFIPNNNGYVMLSLINDAQIQKLSNKALNALADLRDKHALIPAWAAQDVGRKLIFNQYGSPAVLNYFDPHVSIFTAHHLNQEDRSYLYAQLQKLIAEFTQSHQTQVHAMAYAIGVGIAEEQGQIVKELTSFTLGQ